MNLQSHDAKNASCMISRQFHVIDVMTRYVGSAFRLMVFGILKSIQRLGFASVLNVTRWYSVGYWKSICCTIAEVGISRKYLDVCPKTVRRQGRIRCSVKGVNCGDAISITDSISARP